MNAKIIRKVLLVTYLILIILTFIPPLRLGVNEDLFHFLLPIFIFNIVFWAIYSFVAPTETTNTGEDNFLQSFSVILLHLPILIIIDVIPSPLNALVFGLFATLVIALS